jgi:hypothetical protein
LHRKKEDGWAWEYAGAGKAVAVGCGLALILRNVLGRFVWITHVGVGRHRQAKECTDPSVEKSGSYGRRPQVMVRILPFLGGRGGTSC